VLVVTRLRHRGVGGGEAVGYASFGGGGTRRASCNGGGGSLDALDVLGVV
jgi:hypothetical protein